MDRSDERLVSGSDLAVSVDGSTGRLNGDWYEEEEFEAALEKLCGPEEDMPESESEDEVWDTESDSDGSEASGSDASITFLTLRSETTSNTC